jgi:hypothetical protein
MEWVRASAFVAGVVVISMTVFLLLRRSIDFRQLQQHNDVAGFIYAVIGILYGVLIAFVVIVVWERYTEIERTIEDEANVIMQIHRDADAFPGPFRDALRDRLRSYVQDIVAYETQGPQDARGSDRVKRSLDALWQTYSSFIPEDDNDRVWYAETIRRLNALARDRELRLNGLRHHLPTVMWIVLGVGGAITIAFAYFFGTSNALAHVLMIAGLSTTMALTMLLLWSLSHPYSGLGQVDFAPMRDALEIVGSQ